MGRFILFAHAQLPFPAAITLCVQRLAFVIATLTFSIKADLSAGFAPWPALWFLLHIQRKPQQGYCFVTVKSGDYVVSGIL